MSAFADIIGDRYIQREGYIFLLEYITYENENENEEYVVLLHGIGGNSSIFYKQLKAYKENFNVIAIHLPGHGNSPHIRNYEEPFSFELVTKEVKELLHSLHIYKAHFVGISLGSILIHNILQTYPSLVKSAVLGGTITRFTTLSKVLFTWGDLMKNFLPYMWLYSLFARIMMPKANHKNSRNTFIKEAKKMDRQDFLGWFKITKSVEHTHQFIKQKAKGIPRLYISGKEDHLFIHPLIEDMKQDKDASIQILEHCGHICNIEKGKEFNRLSLNFIKQFQDKIHPAS